MNASKPQRATLSTITAKRVYDEPTEADGTRVLVDRLWPRGLSKGDSHLDEWCKQIAPSTKLRRWYDHDPARHAEFSHRYLDELQEPEPHQAVIHLRELADAGPVTLLTATKDLNLSHTGVLIATISSKRRITTPSDRPRHTD